MTGLLRDRGVRAFLVIWAGQLVSLIGSGMTALAIGIQVFQETGSAARFTLMTFCTALPLVLVPPLAGPLGGRPRCRMTLTPHSPGAAGPSAQRAAGLCAWFGR